MESVDQAASRIMREMEAVMAAAANEAADLLLHQMVRLTSLLDHTLKDLAAMGHPYRAKSPMGSGPHPDYMLHSQSNQLAEGLYALPVKKSGFVFTAEIHSDAPHTWFVLLGTRKMRARDFVSAALITERALVGHMLEMAFRHVLSGGEAAGFEPEIHLIPHDGQPAQLP